MSPGAGRLATEAGWLTCGELRICEAEGINGEEVSTLLLDLAFSSWNRLFTRESQ